MFLEDVVELALQFFELLLQVLILQPIACVFVLHNLHLFVQLQDASRLVVLLLARLLEELADLIAHLIVEADCFEVQFHAVA